MFTLNKMTLAVVMLVLSSGCGGYHDSAQPLESIEGTINLNDLPMVYDTFKIAPYVRAAAEIQSMGKDKGCRYLYHLGGTPNETGQIAILCRMLFSKKGKSEFRPLGFGHPEFLGGTGADDWPLLPLELIDNVPFFIISGYSGAGEAEHSRAYLKYCQGNCEWSKTPFDKVTDETIEKALEKLLASKKWKTPLTDYQREYLISQTK